MVVVVDLAVGTEDEDNDVEAEVEAADSEEEEEDARRHMASATLRELASEHMVSAILFSSSEGLGSVDDWVDTSTGRGRDG